MRRRQSGGLAVGRHVKCLDISVWQVDLPEQPAAAGFPESDLALVGQNQRLAVRTEGQVGFHALAAKADRPQPHGGASRNRIAVQIDLRGRGFRCPRPLAGNGRRGRPVHVGRRPPSVAQPQHGTRDQEQRGENIKA